MQETAHQTDSVAVYGAVTATIALFWGVGWSVYTWRRQFRTRVKVELMPELTRHQDGAVEISGLVARLINHSTHEISLQSVLVIRDGDRSVLDWKLSARGSIIRARHSEEFHFGIANSVHGQTVRASVGLATGKNVRSKAVNLADPSVLKF